MYMYGEREREYYVPNSPNNGMYLPWRMGYISGMDIRLIHRVNNKKCDKRKQNSGFAKNNMRSW